jgi:hypothetical protein
MTELLLKAVTGRRNRLPHHGKVGQAVSPVECVRAAVTLVSTPASEASR